VDTAPEIGFNRYTITNLHALLSHNLLADPAASGRLQTFPVGITSSTYLPPGLPSSIGRDVSTAKRSCPCKRAKQAIKKRIAAAYFI